MDGQTHHNTTTKAGKISRKREEKQRTMVQLAEHQKRRTAPMSPVSEKFVPPFHPTPVAPLLRIASHCAPVKCHSLQLQANTPSYPCAPLSTSSHSPCVHHQQPTHQRKDGLIRHFFSFFLSLKTCRTRQSMQ